MCLIISIAQACQVGVHIEFFGAKKIKAPFGTLIGFSLPEDFSLDPLKELDNENDGEKEPKCQSKEEPDDELHDQNSHGSTCQLTKER